ncbi:hypothetical protein NHQ30_006519 [Ciborinia camelliae]|nr:hypothetical protein NHQ30_006519 [Ciborinia camelliae]
MSHDPHNLYNFKKPKLHDSSTHELSSSTNLAFSSTLSSLLASNVPSSSTTRGRPRPSKTKEDIFKTHNKGAQKRAAKDLEDDENGYTQIRQTGEAIDDHTLHRSKKKLAEKAKIYSRLKRGENDGLENENEEEGLVDFDRKWAEEEGGGGGGEKDEDEDNHSDDSFEASAPAPASASNPIIEYEDEYGRLIRGTELSKQRMQRRRTQRLLNASSLELLSARPSMPQHLIHGDTIQTSAFTHALDASTEEKMAALARKRDRSPTPPEQLHYEADREVRSKGQGFYSFSKDERVRAEEMASLERMRGETERGRGDRERGKDRRRREVEERRRVLGEKRAKRQADAFWRGWTKT